MEKQRAGFDYQKNVIEKYKLTPDSNYTGHWDAYFNGIPVSIKLEKYKSDIELADIFRQMDVKEDFFMLVGFWKDEKDNIIEEHLLYIPANLYNNYFNHGMKKEFYNLLNSITNFVEDDEKWRREISNLRKAWAKTTNNYIRLRFKRDHKKQKRVQCAINNKIFYSHFIPNYEVKGFERNNEIFGEKGFA